VAFIATLKTKFFYVAGAFKLHSNLLRTAITKMFYYTYVLQSLKDQSFYIGYTSNLGKRLEEHNGSCSMATKPRRPYKLIYYEAFLDKKDAKDREIYLKSGWGRRSIKKLLKNYLS